jgi:2-methylcitrate dehydratase PrpD
MSVSTTSSTGGGVGITENLAAIVAGLRYEDLPDDVIAKTLMCVIDVVGCAAAASQLPWIQTVRRYALDVGREGRCPVIGGGRLHPEFAALSNAAAAHGMEMDDYHNDALSHPSCVAVAAALAIAQDQDNTGKELVLACAIGIETILRIGLATAPSMVLDGGFHETGIQGVFGAAAAAGKLMGLRPEALESAFGVAASHASGTRQYSYTGGEVKRLHAGLGAAGGIRGAKLAAAGFGGPKQIFEGEQGLFKTFVPDPKPARMLAGIGRQWQLLDIGVKPYANNALIHPSVDALLVLVAENGLRPEDIAEVTVGVDRLTIHHVGSLPLLPGDMNGAQFNLPYSVGMAIARGSNSFADYVQLFRDGFDDPAVLEAGRKVRMWLDPEIDAAFPGRLSSRVRVTTASGKVIERVGVGRGSKDHPFSIEDVRAKFADLLTATPWAASSESVLKAIEGLPEAPSVAGVLDPLS